VLGPGLLAIATPALAQAPAAVPADSVTPSFVLMDVDGDRSKLEIEAGMGFVTGDGSGQLWTGRFRLQAMFDRTFGLYATLQGGAITGGGESDTGLGNPELGGVAHIRTSAVTDVSFHAGLVVSLTDGGLGGQIAGIALRPADVPLVAGGTSWLRGGTSATYHDHAVFARVDLGLDQQLDADNETFVHVNGGLGLGNRQWSAAAELQVLFADHGDTAETAGVSLHYHGASASPYVSIATPVGGDLFADVILVSAGASFAL
jgi:hypothetical protein